MPTSVLRHTYLQGSAQHAANFVLRWHQTNPQKPLAHGALTACGMRVPTHLSQLAPWLQNVGCGAWAVHRAPCLWQQAPGSRDAMDSLFSQPPSTKSGSPPSLGACASLPRWPRQPQRQRSSRQPSVCCQRCQHRQWGAQWGRAVAVVQRPHARQRQQLGWRWVFPREQRQLGLAARPCIPPSVPQPFAGAPCKAPLCYLPNSAARGPGTGWQPSGTRHPRRPCNGRRGCFWRVWRRHGCSPTGGRPSVGWEWRWWGLEPLASRLLPSTQQLRGPTSPACHLPLAPRHARLRAVAVPASRQRQQGAIPRIVAPCGS